MGLVDSFLSWQWKSGHWAADFLLWRGSALHCPCGAHHHIHPVTGDSPPAGHGQVDAGWSGPSVLS